jgi:hypothetical protein
MALCICSEPLCYADLGWRLGVTMFRQSLCAFSRSCFCASIYECIQKAGHFCESGQLGRGQIAGLMIRRELVALG